MKKENTAFNKLQASFKEFVRKILVFLKRNPSFVPLLALAVSFVYYSFNLTYISQTTLLINTKHMGLSCFITMLFSILSFVGMLNAFPKRKKPNFAMLLLLAVLFSAIIIADNFYCKSIIASNIEITPERSFVPIANKVVSTHIILMLVTTALTALEPVIAKLFKKINTSFDIEYEEAIDNIELAEEE